MGRNWCRVLQETPGLEVVCVVDPGVAGRVPEARMSDAGVAYEAAVIATPTPTHYHVIARLLAVGVDVLVEKPLASTVAQCREIADFASGTSSRYVVGHVERFNPAVRALQAEVDSGRLGTPIHVSTTRVGGYPTVLAPGNDVLLDLAVHDLDLLRRMLGPLRVEASMCHATVRRDVCDTAEILLSASGGPTAALHTNWITPTKIRTVRVTGSKGVALVDLIEQTCRVDVGAGLVDVAVDRVEPLRAQAAAFARWLEGEDAGDLCSGEDATAAVTLAEKALGADRGGWV